MPLTMNTDGQRAKPGVICDACGKPITEARDGNAQWKMGDEGKGSGCRIYFTHKACCHAFDHANPGMGANELSHFMVFLANNLKINWEEAKKNAALIASIG